MAWITYGGFSLDAQAITGGYLPTSGLGYISGGAVVHVDATHPFPVSLGSVVLNVAQSGAWSVAVSSLPAVTFASAQPVTQSGTWSVTASGSVSVSNLPATQTVDGAVSLTGTLPAFAATPTVDVGNWPATQPVSLASLPSLAAGSATIGKVDQGAAGASAWKVDGSGVTQPVSGSVAASQSGSWSVSVTSAPTTAITAAALPLPSGAATEGGNLATLAGAVSGGRVLVTEASAASILAVLAHLTDATQVSSVGASASSTGAWTRTVYSGSSSPALSFSQSVKASAGRVRRVHVSNKSGVSIWVGITNSSTALGNAAAVEYDASVGNATGARLHDFGESGQYFSAGICLTISKTQQATDNTTTLTNVIVIIEWI